MPKRARTSSQNRPGHLSNSLDDDNREDMDHTPKWTRSSASPTPSPSTSVAGAMDHNNGSRDRQMQCVLLGHPPMILASVAEYELHYAKEHNNQCFECRVNLPSEWMLELHQIENHDPLVAARRDKGEKTYRCFLHDCEKVTLTSQKRRLHLIDKHGFPRDYDFRLVDSGSHGKSSLLRDSNIRKPQSSRRRRISDVGTSGWRDRPTPVIHSTPIQEGPTNPIEGQHTNLRDPLDGRTPLKMQNSSQVETDSVKQTGDASMDSLNKAMSSLSFVPLSVRMRSKKSTEEPPV